MNRIKLTVILLCFVFIFTPFAFSSEDNTKPVVKKEEPAQPKKEFTRDEKMKAIKSNLDSFGEITNSVQGLKKEADASGAAFYTLQGTKIEDLNDDALDKLFSRVNTEAVRLRTDRLNRQLETIRRANEITRMNRQATAVPNIPKTYTPPYQAPAIPKPVPKTPIPIKNYSTRSY